ncbi:MAG: thioredoxin domain-containing protein [Minisyncoccia bacterium]
MEGQESTVSTPTPPKQNNAVPFAIVIAGLAIAGAIYFGDGKNNAVPTGIGQGIGTIEPLTADDHIVGNPNAKVIIVEYSDTECPFCISFHPTMQRIMSEYGKDGKVAWVYRHLPYHTKAPKETEATECANKLGGNTKFWEYLGKIFETTKGNNSLDEAELPKIAQAVGLDVTAFNTCLNSGEMKAVVDKSLASAAKSGISGTPFSVILVNKKVTGAINGAQPYEQVKAQIDELLK